MNMLIRLAIAAASGGLLALAFPGMDWSGIAWMVMIPFVAVLWMGVNSKSGRKGWLIGYVFGLAFFCVSLRWVNTVSWLGMLVLAAYLAVYPAIWAAFAAKWWNPWHREEPNGILSRSLRSLGYGAALAAIWAGLELVRGWMFTGFSWNVLGVATHKNAVLMQGADLFGVSGLSFLMVLVQVVVLQVVARMWRRARAGVGRWGAHPDFGLSALLICGLFVYGVWRLRTVPAAETFSLRVLLVQLNVPQMAAQQLWSAEEIHYAYGEEVQRAMDSLSEEHRKALQTAGEEENVEIFYPDWLVLPEVALNGRLMTTADGEYAMWRENDETLQWFRESGIDRVVFGVGELEAKLHGDQLSLAEDPQAWNSMVMFGPDGMEMAYRKRHLVMFGEYIPLLEQLPWLQAIYENQAGGEYHGAYAAGTQTEPLPVSVRGQKFSVIPSICFEDSVAAEARSFIRNEMQIMVNVTNDGWFAQSDAAAQHFANAKFRAVELRRPILRCANTGVSGLVSVTGSAKTLQDENGSHFTRGYMFGTLEVPLQPIRSLYQVWGDLPLWLAGALALIATLLKARRKV